MESQTAWIPVAKHTKLRVSVKKPVNNQKAGETRLFNLSESYKALTKIVSL